MYQAYIKIHTWNLNIPYHISRSIVEDQLYMFHSFWTNTPPTKDIIVYYLNGNQLYVYNHEKKSGIFYDKNDAATENVGWNEYKIMYSQLGFVEKLIEWFGQSAIDDFNSGKILKLYVGTKCVETRFRITYHHISKDRPDSEIEAALKKLLHVPFTLNVTRNRGMSTGELYIGSLTILRVIEPSVMNV